MRRLRRCEALLLPGSRRLVSARPTAELEANVSLAYNPEFDEREIQALVSGPMSESVRGRVVVLSRQMDEGWVANASYPEDNPASEELFARGSLEWDISERTELYAKYEGGDFDVVGQPWVIWAGGPISPLLAAAGVPEYYILHRTDGHLGFFSLSPSGLYQPIAPVDGVLNVWVAPSDDPSAAGRTVRIVLTDGDGGTSTAVTETINVAAVNDDPVVALPGAAVSFTEGDGATLSGSIVSDLTLSAAASPHVVTGDVRIEAGATLTVEPGAVVMFAPNSTARMNGSTLTPSC